MTVPELRSELQRQHDALFRSIRALGEEQFRRVPAGEQWSIATHLAHLLRIERLHAGYVELALRQDGAPIAATGITNEDEPGLAQKLAVPQMIHGLQAARRQLDDALARCDDASLLRGIEHERRGRISIAQAAAKMAAHEAEHAAEIMRLARMAHAPIDVTIPLTRRS